MPETSRREFIKASTAAAAGALAFSRSSYAAILGANDRIRFAVIGCGGMGSGHLGSLVKRSTEDNIKVVAVSDVYERRLFRAKGVCQTVYRSSVYRCFSGRYPSPQFVRFMTTMALFGNLRRSSICITEYASLG